MAAHEVDHKRSGPDGLCIDFRTLSASVDEFETQSREVGISGFLGLDESKPVPCLCVVVNRSYFAVQDFGERLGIANTFRDKLENAGEKTHIVGVWNESVAWGSFGH